MPNNDEVLAECWGEGMAQGGPLSTHLREPARALAE
jgi:hypothetical protein